MSVSAAPKPLQIGLIGAGNIGSALARLFAAQGHAVLLSNSRRPHTLHAKAAALGVTAVTAEEAARAADVVVVSIHLALVPQLAPLFAAVGADVVVVDTNNYYPCRDGRIAELDDGRLVDSEWVAARLGRAPGGVVKCFNNMFYRSLESKPRPRGAPDRVALAVSGGPQRHRATVMALVDSIGFDAVDGGALGESWRQQPGAPCSSKDYGADALRSALAEAEMSKLALYRQAANDYIVRNFPQRAEDARKVVVERLG